LLNSKQRGFAIDNLVAFNILWLIPSGVTALLVGMICILSINSCSVITKSLNELKLGRINCGKVTFSSLIFEIPAKNEFKASIFSLSVKTIDIFPLSYLVCKGGIIDVEVFS